MSENKGTRSLAEIAASMPVGNPLRDQVDGFDDGYHGRHRVKHRTALYRRAYARGQAAAVDADMWKGKAA